MSKLVAVVPKNQTQEIRIELGEFNGHDLVHIRVWVDRRDGEGGRLPTKAGVVCRVGLLPELIAALQSAEVEARRQGLLPRPTGDLAAARPAGEA